MKGPGYGLPPARHDKRSYHIAVVFSLLVGLPLFFLNPILGLVVGGFVFLMIFGLG